MLLSGQPPVFAPFADNIGPELRQVLAERSSIDIAALASAHTNTTVLLAVASVYDGHATFLAKAALPVSQIPVPRCRRLYYYNQVPQLLAECLPFARRGAFNVFAHAGASAEQEAEELRLAAALGAAGFLVMLRVPEHSGIAKALPQTYVLVAPNTFVFRTAVAHTIVTGAIRSSSAFAAPMLLLGDPTAGTSEHVDLDALGSEGVLVILYLHPYGGRQSVAFHEAMVCSERLSLAVVSDEAREREVKELGRSCPVPLMRARRSVAGLRGADALAAQFAALLAPEPSTSAVFRPDSLQSATAAIVGTVEAIALTGLVPQRADHCSDSEPFVWTSFLVRCLPGRRGVYVQARTIAFDMKLYQRPQHISKAMARHNMLVVYVQEFRALGQLRRSEVHPNLFLADENLAKVSDITGSVVNVHSTMVSLVGGAITNLANTGNAVVFEYIDAIDEAITGDTVPQLEALRAEALGAAKLVVYSARSLLKDINSTTRSPESYAFVPNGVDLEMYDLGTLTEAWSGGGAATTPAVATPRSIQHIVAKGKPIVGYFGAIAPWIWLEADTEMATLVPEAEFLLIGPPYGNVVIPKAANRPPNLHFHRPVAARNLVRFGRHFTVGLIPFRKGEIAQTTSPLKLFEYFALGLPTVVTDDMQECTRFSEVRSARSPTEFAQQLRLAIRDAADEELRGRIRRLAEANSWDSRAQVTLDALANLLQKATG